MKLFQQGPRARGAVAWMMVACIALAEPSFARDAEPVALVTELQGAGKVTQRAESTALELLHELVPGAEVELQPGTRGVLVHTSAQRVFELEGPGRYRITPAAVSALGGARLRQRDVPAEIRAYRLKAGAATQASLAMRSGAALEGPRGGVLEASELVYRLRGNINGAALQVTRADGTVVWRGALSTDALSLDALPAVAEALASLDWLVLSVSGTDARGKPVRLSARFRLVEPSQAAPLAARRPGSEGTPTDAALYALALESIGADATAVRYWDRVVGTR